MKLKRDPVNATPSKGIERGNGLRVEGVAQFKTNRRSLLMATFTNPSGRGHCTSDSTDPSVMLAGGTFTRYLYWAFSSNHG